ncbi:MAG: Flp pilus assembly complex ATPase component TadA, partial [Candidatus Thermoplasmatota archaeon]|nr:Flp pilus assembly complex ATPase component TadA [Candidatus Thermoplasmatota archaeon]
IIVGEIRGREAYVLFQAMSTGHTTYSTVQADIVKSLIHRLEDKPIEIPRVMLQALDIVSIHFSTNVKGKHVRRCKQVIEIIDIDPTTKEVLTNEVFRWDPIEDKFIYTGKSYVLERIRTKLGMSKEEITHEIRQRTEILEWMQKNNLRTFKEVAKVISRYAENSDDFLKKLKDANKKENIIKNSISDDSKKPSITKVEIVEKIEEPIDNDLSYIDAFKEVSFIDKDIAKILFDNKIKSIEDLKNSSYNELIKIKGIDKKTAKKIVKEVEKMQNKSNLIKLIERW